MAGIGIEMALPLVIIWQTALARKTARSGV